jgi:hypothetical protein
LTLTMRQTSKVFLLVDCRYRGFAYKETVKDSLNRLAGSLGLSISHVEIVRLVNEKSQAKTASILTADVRETPNEI